jgi:uncharacterized protein (DUF58 family)
MLIFENLAQPQRWINLHRVLWLLVVVCFFIAWNRGLALLHGLFSLSMVLLLISYLMPWLQLRGIQIERIISDDLAAGSQGTINYCIRAKERRCHVTLREDLPFAG